MQIDKVVTHIDVDSDSVIVTLEDGTKLYFYHSQSCCESVYIYDWKGDPHQLVGKKLLMIEEDNDDFTNEMSWQPNDSYTCTNFKFITNEDTVISRWIGESNGYYSESVDLDVIAPKVK
jgi:hypothetical protein